MYNILCASLVRSRGPLANFTHSYKRVANRYQLEQGSSTVRDNNIVADEKDKESTYKVKPSTQQSKKKPSFSKLESPQKSELLKNGSIKYVIPKSRFSPLHYFSNHFIKYNQQVQSFSRKSFLMQTATKKPSFSQNPNKKATTVTFTRKPLSLAYSINQGKCFSTKKFFLNEEALETYKQAMKTVKDIAKVKNLDRQWKEPFKKFETNTLDEHLYSLPNQKKTKAKITYPVKYIKHELPLHKRFKIRDSQTENRTDTSKSVKLVKPVKNPRKIGSTDLIGKLLNAKKQEKVIKKKKKINISSKPLKKIDTDFKPTFKIIKPIAVSTKITITDILKKGSALNKAEANTSRKLSETRTVKNKQDRHISNFQNNEPKSAKGEGEPKYVTSKIVNEETKRNEVNEHLQPFERGKAKKSFTENVDTLEGEVTKKYAMGSQKEPDVILVDSSPPNLREIQHAPTPKKLSEAKWIKIHPEVRTTPKELKRKLKNKFMGLLLKKQNYSRMSKIKNKAMEQPKEKEDEINVESEVNHEKIEDLVNALTSEEATEIKNQNDTKINNEQQYTVIAIQPQIMTEQDENIFNKCYPRNEWAESTKSFEVNKVCIKENNCNYQNVTDFKRNAAEDILDTRDNLKRKIINDQTAADNFAAGQPESIDSTLNKSAFALKIEALTKNISENDVTERESLRAENKISDLKFKATNLDTAKKLLEYKYEQLQLKEQLAEISQKLTNLESKQGEVWNNSIVKVAKEARSLKESLKSKEYKNNQMNQKLQKDPHEEEEEPDVVVIINDKAKTIDKSSKKFLNTKSNKEQTIKKTHGPNLPENIQTLEINKAELQKKVAKPTKNVNKIKKIPKIMVTQENEKKIDILNKTAQINANYADNLRKKKEELIEIKKLREQFNSQSSLKSKVPQKDVIKLTKTQERIKGKKKLNKVVKREVDKFEIARKIAAQMKHREVNIIDQNEQKITTLEREKSIMIEKDPLQSKSTSVLENKNLTDIKQRVKLTKKELLESKSVTPVNKNNQFKSEKVKSLDKDAFYIKKQKEWTKIIADVEDSNRLGRNLDISNEKNTKNELLKEWKESNMLKKIFKQCANIVEDKIEGIKTTVNKKSLDKEQKGNNKLSNISQKGLKILDNKVEALKEDVVDVIDIKVNEIKENRNKKFSKKERVEVNPITEVKLEVRPRNTKTSENKSSAGENLQKIMSCPSVAFELLKRKDTRQLQNKSKNDSTLQNENETIADNQTLNRLVIDYKTIKVPHKNIDDNFEQVLNISKDLESNEKPDNSKKYHEFIFPQKSQVVFYKEAFDEQEKNKNCTEVLPKSTIESLPFESNVIENQENVDLEKIVNLVKSKNALLDNRNLSAENAVLLRELENISLEFAESMLKKDLTNEDITESIESEESDKNILDKILAHKDTILEKNISTLEGLEKVNEFLKKLENLEQKILFEKSSKDVKVGNRVRVPTPPKPDPKTEQKIKKEKPKSQKDMVFPPRIKGNKPDRSQTKNIAENNIKNKVKEVISNVQAKENSPEFLMNKNKDFSDIIFMKKQTLSEEILPFDNDKIQPLGGVQKMKLEIEVCDDKSNVGKFNNNQTLDKKPSENLVLKAKHQTSATDTKFYEVKIENASEPTKNYIEKYLGPTYEISASNIPKTTIEQLKKTVILVFNPENKTILQTLKSKNVFPQKESNEKNSFEFLQHNATKNNHTYDLMIDLPQLTPKSSRNEFLSKNITKSAIRAAKSMSEINNQKSDLISTGGNSRTLCQKSGNEDDTPEIRKLRECLKEREAKSSFEWPKKGGSKKDDHKGEDSCKRKDPCTKPEEPCKKKEDSCKKREDPCRKNKDPCKKKEDPCKKNTDPCKKKEDPCKKKEDPCKKNEDSCKKKENPCKKKEDPCKKKEDPCKKKEDSCKKKEDPCNKKENSCKKKEDEFCASNKDDLCKSKKGDPCTNTKRNDSCKDKQDDFCSLKCGPMETGTTMDCSSKNIEKISEPNKDAAAK